MRMAQRLQVSLPPTWLDIPGDPRVQWSNWVCRLELDFFTSISGLTDRAKSAHLCTLLGWESSHILMAHPAEEIAATATCVTFKDNAKPHGHFDSLWSVQHYTAIDGEHRCENIRCENIARPLFGSSSGITQLVSWQQQYTTEMTAYWTRCAESFTLPCSTKARQWRQTCTCAILYCVWYSPFSDWSRPHLCFRPTHW